MRILLTGGSGMVGKNILEAAQARGIEVLAPGRADMNLLDRNSTEQFIKAEQPDLIIHAAGRVGGIQANIAHPVAFLVENLDMARNLIGAAHATGVRKLLNIGSSCMYPRGHQDPLKEEMVLSGELEPTNEGYAIAKIFAAKYCSYIQREDSTFLYKTLIPCNLYGRFDKFDPVHSHMIPAVIRKIHIAVEHKASTVEIWGDGKARREFMDAADLADFVLTAIGRFDSLPDVLNVGLGHDYSVLEYYQVVAKVVGFKGDFTFNLTKPTGMQRKLVSIDRLNAWGWSAPTSLEDGIRRSYEYFLSTNRDR